MSNTVVLVVDDEPQIRDILGYIVESMGYEWLGAQSIAQAQQVLDTQAIDLILLDVMLPDASGIDLCRSVRAHSLVPIILISALGEENDRIRGLEAGADDYITKPFSPREVALRIEAILRRNNTGTRIDHDGLTLDPVSGDVSFKGNSIVLPITEARVLALLLEHYNRTVGFTDFLSNVWNTTESVGGREMVRITIHRLRAHLKQLSVSDNLIESVRGMGYRIRRPIH